MINKLQTVHVRVNDAATGQPTPCRVRFTGEDGTYYAPLGRSATLTHLAFHDDGGNVLLGGREYAYIDGVCEINLPAGSTRVEIHKGLEFRSVDTQVDLLPGKLALRFSLERWVDLRSEGWFSGDTRAQFLTPHTALLEGAGEDLAVVNLLARDWRVIDWQGEKFVTMPSLTAFSGERPALELPGHMVVVNTLNSASRLGQVALLNCHRIVYPLSFSDPWLNWTIADWCDQCHRKAGLVVWNPEGRARFPGSLSYKDDKLYNFGEVLADLVLGKFDAFEVEELHVSCSPSNHAWYNFLNCGFRLPLVGSANKHDNTRALGQVRTYARLREGEEFNYGNWIEAVRAGRTFVTNGPLLSFEVNGRQPGDVLSLPAGAAHISVRARAKNLRPIERIEIVVNGKVAAVSKNTGDSLEAAVEVDVPLPGSAWVAARCRVPLAPAEQGRFRFVGAHSAPVYVDVEGQLFRPDPAIVKFLIEALDWWIDWLHWEKNNEYFQGDHQRDRLAGVFVAAREELERRAKRESR
jgi:hypothetical protein